MLVCTSGFNEGAERVISGRAMNEDVSFELLLLLLAIVRRWWRATHMADCSVAAFLLLDASGAAPGRGSVDARVARGAVIPAAALTATMYTFHVTLHTIFHHHHHAKQTERKKKT